MCSTGEKLALNVSLGAQLQTKKTLTSPKKIRRTSGARCSKKERRKLQQQNQSTERPVLGTHGADQDENRVGFKAPELAAPPTGVRLADQRRKSKAQPDRWQLKRTRGNPGDDTCTHARDSVQGLKAGQEIGAGLRNGEKTSSRTGSGREKKEQIVRTTEETGDATDVGTTLCRREIKTRCA
jgi:hypothetical protein